MEKKIREAISLMIHNNRNHKKLADLCVEGVGIDRTRHLILIHINEYGTMTSQKELAEHLNITQAAVTLALKKLEGDGFIKRKVAKDNRFHETVITDSGKELLEKTKKIFDEIDRNFFSEFSENEIDIYIELSKKINNNLKSSVECIRRDG